MEYALIVLWSKVHNVHSKLASQISVQVIYISKRKILKCFEKYVQIMYTYLNLPVIHKVDDVGIFVLLKFENKMDREITQFNYKSKHHYKCKFVLKLALNCF